MAVVRVRYKLRGIHNHRLLVATLIAGDGALLSATQPAAAPAPERCCAVSSVLCVPRFGNHLTASCAV